MKKIKTIIFIALLVVCLSGFTHGKELDRTDYLEDYEILWQGLTEYYLFFPAIESKGINIEGVKQETYQQINDLPEMNHESFTFILGQMFRKFDNFAHLGLLDEQGYQTYKEYYCDNLEDPFWKELLFYETVADAYSHTNDLVVNENTKLPNINCLFDRNTKTLFIKIRSFDISCIEEDKTLIIENINEWEDSIDNIVFDITGNVGGNDNYWKNLVKLFGADCVWEQYLYMRDNEVTDLVVLGNSQMILIEQMSNHPVPSFVEELGLTHFTYQQEGFEYEPEIHCDARKWILIDEKVYSSADTFADFCKSTGWATLVGRNTGGDGKGMMPALIKLPNTGLLVRFSVVCSENSKGELNVLHGTIPDYYCIKKETPQAAFYRIIETN